MLKPSQLETCFACGQENPIGLKLSFEYDANGCCYSRINLHHNYNGWPGVTHGGIVATILDEVAYYAIYEYFKLADTPWLSGFTTNMNLDYKAPTPLEKPLLAKGWVKEKRRNIIVCQAELSSEEDQRLLASARVSYFMKKNRS